MRKTFSIIIITFLFVFVGGATSDASIILKTGYSPGAAVEMSGTGTVRVNGEIYEEETFEATVDYESNFLASLELFVIEREKLGLGVGGEYQLPRINADNENIELQFIPLYGVINIRPIPEAYITGKAGYNLFSWKVNDMCIEDIYSEMGYEDTTLEGGFYYAVGGGISFDFLVLEVLYSVQNGRFTAINEYEETGNGYYIPGHPFTHANDSYEIKEKAVMDFHLPSITVYLGLKF